MVYKHTVVTSLCENTWAWNPQCAGQTHNIQQQMTVVAPSSCFSLHADHHTLSRDKRHMPCWYMACRWQTSGSAAQCTHARRGLGSLCDVTAMPPKSATSMAPKATVPRMRPMLLPTPGGAAQKPSAVFDPAPSTAGATHTSSEVWIHQR